MNRLDYLCGLSDEDVTHRFKEAVKLELRKCKIMGQLIAKYDKRKKAPYILYPDGRKEY